MMVFLKDKRHSTLHKLNTLHLMYQRNTVTNVQTFNKKGEAASYAEGMRLVAESAELAEYYKTSKYNLELGCQLTLDNVDIVLKDKLGKIYKIENARKYYGPIGNKDLRI